MFDERCADWQDDIFVQVSESMVGRAVRTKRWKYGICAPEKDGWEHSASDRYTERCLYDLDNDPWEQNDLTGQSEYREIAEEMRGRMLARMSAAGEAPVTIKPACS